METETGGELEAEEVDKRVTDATVTERTGI